MIINVLGDEEASRVKQRLLKTPEKKRQAILNQVEAQLGNKLVEFVSDFKDTLLVDRCHKTELNSGISSRLTRT